jgi:AraC-like DNA-binding protein
MLATREKPPSPRDASFLAFVREENAFDHLWHLHAEYELTLIVRGQGRRLVGDDVSYFNAGDLVLVGSNLPHTWASQRQSDQEPSHRAIVIQFDRKFLGDSFFSRPELRDVDRLLERAQLGLYFLASARERVARQIVRIPQQRGLPRLLTLLEVLQTLAHTRRVRALSSAGFSPSVRQGDDARIKRFSEYVDANLDAELSLRKAADHMHMSPRTLTRFLKRTLGKTFIDHINELRVGHACAQLINTRKSVKEICYHAGFHNLSHFNRRFRAVKNCTPREYRHAHES